jgi:hypothetical protein
VVVSRRESSCQVYGEVKSGRLVLLQSTIRGLDGGLDARQGLLHVGAQCGLRSVSRRLTISDVADRQSRTDCEGDHARSPLRCVSGHKPHPAQVAARRLLA